MNGKEMDQFDRWALAFAWTESGDDPRAWGDKGAASGRWQIHPAFFHDYLPEPNNPVWQGTWDEVMRATLLIFYRVRVHGYGLTVAEGAQCFHLGWSAFESGERDQQYAGRFLRYWQLAQPSAR